MPAESEKVVKVIIRLLSREVELMQVPNLL